jgi:hypothetical protein
MHQFARKWKGLVMKTSKEKRAMILMALDGGDVDPDDVADLLDDADRCEELEEDGHTRGACWQCGEGILEFYCVCLGCHKKELSRISALESAMRKVYYILDDLRDKPGDYSINAVISALKSACAEVKK